MEAKAVVAGILLLSSLILFPTLDAQALTILKRTCGDGMMKRVPCKLMDSVENGISARGSCLIFCSSKKKIKGKDGRMRNLCLTGDPRADEIIKCREQILKKKTEI
ncbi:pAG2 protein [Curionopolis virus]|nr:pAG2 protein [Curionopolis virus]